MRICIRRHRVLSHSALTQGRFEVSGSCVVGGRPLVLCAGAIATAPYPYDVYRVPSGGGKLQRVTLLQGLEKFALDHAGKQLLVTHSSP